MSFMLEVFTLFTKESIKINSALQQSIYFFSPDLLQDLSQGSTAQSKLDALVERQGEGYRSHLEVWLLDHLLWCRHAHSHSNIHTVQAGVSSVSLLPALWRDEALRILIIWSDVPLHSSLLCSLAIVRFLIRNADVSAWWSETVLWSPKPYSALCNWVGLNLFIFYWIKPTRKRCFVELQHILGIELFSIIKSFLLFCILLF